MDDRKLGNLSKHTLDRYTRTLDEFHQGFSQSIAACYPNTEIQKCIIHQIRNSTRYVSYKDLKKVTADLKPIYKAATKEVALIELDRFEETWGSKYPLIVRSWWNN